MQIEQNINQNGGYPTELIANLQNVMSARNRSMPSMLLSIYIENMPMIISGFGYKACEQTIGEFLLYLKSIFSHLKQPPLIIRLQKDQIAIYFYNQNEKLTPQNLQQISKQIKEFDFQSEYGAIHLISSISSLQLEENRIDAYDLLNEAYVQLKQNKVGKILTKISYVEESRADMSMVSYINNAIKTGQLCMAFQPIICSKTGDIVHYEALLRVKKLNGELTTAGPLIPVAERMGLIDIIDELVFAMIVEELLENEQLNLSFNVSNLTANSTSWLNNFELIAKQHPNIIPRMMVEITETAVHLNLDKTAYFVACLQSHGAKVALDDFGSGYTSFRQLKSLSLDMIKIDGMFVKGLLDNNDNKLFVKTMLDFTHGFGLQTVAECVEDGETAKMLMQLGVDYMQGYYFGYPQVKSYETPLKTYAAS